MVPAVQEHPRREPGRCAGRRDPTGVGETKSSLVCYSDLNDRQRKKFRLHTNEEADNIYTAKRKQADGQMGMQVAG